MCPSEACIFSIRLGYLIRETVIGLIIQNHVYCPTRGKSLHRLQITYTKHRKRSWKQATSHTQLVAPNYMELVMNQGTLG